jgi:hypothetical protein
MKVRIARNPTGFQGHFERSGIWNCVYSESTNRIRLLHHSSGQNRKQNLIPADPDEAFHLSPCSPVKDLIPPREFGCE